MTLKELNDILKSEVSEKPLRTLLEWVYLAKELGISIPLINGERQAAATREGSAYGYFCGYGYLPLSIKDMESDEWTVYNPSGRILS